MLLMNTTDIGHPPITQWDPVDVKAHIEFMREFTQGLVESGELVSAEGLAMPDQAKIVTARDGAEPAITDGPFPESKEFLAGYWIVDVDGTDRALEIAAAASASPGPGGVTLKLPIEVRQVMSGPDVEV
ncbi:YciI family protein [Actinophytocola sp.]|uniref:YciI family protein n=1 Tax=Actinophytocola sp. TaxID=1872138 RepID=UPI003D6C5223